MKPLLPYARIFRKVSRGRLSGLWQNRAGTGENQRLVEREDGVANRHLVAFAPPSNPARFCLASAHECTFR
ncbi:MAG TPA: hypothetical protein P5525_25330, partial [Candidatus Paceibacterota bacterium]|nr:hypothetical protein [Candidatus Paceibacterota bacterium]